MLSSYRKLALVLEAIGIPASRLPKIAIVASSRPGNIRPLIDGCQLTLPRAGDRAGKRHFMAAYRACLAEAMLDAIRKADPERFNAGPPPA